MILSQSSEFSKFEAALKNTVLPESKFTEVPNAKLNPDKNAVLLRHLNKLAESFGIDFEATGFTFLLAPERGGRTVAMVLEPTVQLDESGKLCVFWGNVTKPLSDIAGFEIGKKYNFRDAAPNVVTLCNLEASEADEDAVGYYEIVVRTIPKSNEQPETINAMTLKRFLKNNKLEALVKVKTSLPKKLAEVVEPNMSYQVIGYGSYETNFNGKADIKYFVIIDGVNGRVQASGNMVSVLKSNPLIDPDHPATLFVGEIKERKNATGSYKVVSNSLIVASVGDGEYFSLEDL